MTFNSLNQIAISESSANKTNSVLTILYPTLQKYSLTKELPEVVFCPLLGKYKLTTSITEKRIENEIYYLMYWAANVRPSKLNEIKITHAIDSILESKGERFGLLLLTTGFNREKSNYAGQIAKGIGIGLLTLGSVYTVPYKEASQLYIMVVDAVDDNIAYFKSSILQEHSPIEFDTYNQHFYQLFKNYK